MKEYSYTSTPPLGPCGLLQVETLPLPYYVIRSLAIRTFSEPPLLSLNNHTFIEH